MLEVVRCSQQEVEPPENTNGVVRAVESAKTTVLVAASTGTTMVPSPGGTALRLGGKPTRAQAKRPRQEAPTNDVLAGSEKTSSSSSAAKEKTNKHQRFSWPSNLQRDFVAAIFDVGLHHASPSSLVEMMPPHAQVSAKSVQSHLRAYLRHRRMLKITCLHQHQAALTDSNTKNDRKPAVHNNSNLSSSIVDTSNNSQKLSAASSGGYPVNPVNLIVPEDMNERQQHTSTQMKGEPAPSQQQSETSIVLPHLTDEEKLSPSGAGMGYLVGLFFSLQSQLMAQRATESGSVSTVVESVAPTAGPCAVAESTAASGQAVPPAATLPASSETFPREARQSIRSAPNALVDTEPVTVSGFAASASAPSAPFCAGTVDDVYHSFVAGGPATIMSATPDHLPVAAGSQPAATTNNPSTRVKLQENSLMKREMESQMVFQNKIRALKRQELEKYIHEPPAVPPPPPVVAHASGISVLEPPLSQDGGEAAPTAASPMEYEMLSGDAPIQRIRGMSIGSPSMSSGENLLSTIYYDQDDQQLFEFLMMGDQDGE